MKIKVGNKIYDSTIEPVMVILTDYDKENIKNMLPECTKYAEYPEDVDPEDMEKWMKEETLTGFNADKITVDNFEGIFNCRKKPITIQALQLNFEEGFVVTTPSGKVRGEPGDYLMFGPTGEKYPCKKEIFEKTYDRV